MRESNALFIKGEFGHTRKSVGQLSGGNYRDRANRKIALIPLQIQTRSLFRTRAYVRIRLKHSSGFDYNGVFE